MSKPVVEPVTGEDRCPECEGKRVIRNDRDHRSKRQILSELRAIYDAMMWDDEGQSWVWCPVCGGSGTATDAMIRLMLGAITMKP